MSSICWEKSFRNSIIFCRCTSISAWISPRWVLCSPTIARTSGTALPFLPSNTWSLLLFRSARNFCTRCSRASRRRFSALSSRSMFVCVASMSASSAMACMLFFWSMTSGIREAGGFVSENLVMACIVLSSIRRGSDTALYHTG